ncbi:hypothetical protein CR513_35351, partial [Mucuna pruriens]
TAGGELNYSQMESHSAGKYVISQFMSSPIDTHWEALISIKYLKKALGKGNLYQDHGHAGTSPHTSNTTSLYKQRVMLASLETLSVGQFSRDITTKHRDNKLMFLNHSPYNNIVFLAGRDGNKPGQASLTS